MVTLNDGTTTHINPLNGIVENNFRYHRLGSFIGIHAVFFSSYILFAYCILLIQYFLRNANMGLKYHIMYLVGLMFLAVMIFLLQSIVISASFVLLTFLILLYFAYLRTKRVKTLTISLMTIILIGTIFSINIYNKLDSKDNPFYYDMSLRPDRIDRDESNWNPMNIRLAIWENSLEVIGDHWLLGVGPANMTEVLDSYYGKNNFVFGSLDHLNSHNQFLHSFIVLGICGFVVLLLLVFSLTRDSIKRKDLVMASLLTIFVLFSLTASTLSVNKGIMFFSFFFSLLIYMEPRAMEVLDSSPDNTIGKENN
ncbi:MAG: O-antigen ligase family protein [Saprospiraceae bacterium]|nr:O-antigen ligase family protein [Saprospiraceae bacterium]